MNVNHLQIVGETILSKRRGYLKIILVCIVVFVIGAASGWFIKPKEIKIVTPPTPTPTPPSGRISISSINPHYFEYNKKQIVLFGASHWTVIGNNNIPFRELNDVIIQYGANSNRATAFAFADPDNQPWVRRSDGKYDLSQFNPSYWSRLKEYLSDCESKGIFVILEIWDEPYIEKRPDRWPVNPWNPNNNVNNIPNLPNDDASYDGSWKGTFYDVTNSKLMHYQDLFVEKLLDETVQFGNVIYEICNEYGGEGRTQFTGHWDWVQHWIDLFIQYELIHKVDLLLTNMPFGEDYNQSEYILSLGIDVIGYFRQSTISSPNFTKLNQIINGFYSRASKPLVSERAILNLARGIDNGTYDDSRREFWATFVSGGHIGSYKDVYKDRIIGNYDYGQLEIIKNLRRFIDKIRFWEMYPNNKFVNNGFALVNVGKEYVIYLPYGGSVDLDLTSTIGTFNVEWYHPQSGEYSDLTSVEGGSIITFTSPFTNDVVLHVYG